MRILDEAWEAEFVERKRRRAEEIKAELKAELSKLTVLDWACFICMCALIFTVGYEWGYEAGMENYRQIVEAVRK